MSLLASQARPATFERALLGVEAPGSPGVVVSAGIALRSIKLGDWQMAGDVKAYPETGSRFNASTSVGTLWMTNDFTGKMTFSQLHMIFDSAMGKATPTVPVGGTNARERIWLGLPYTPIDPQTYTFLMGQPVRWERYPYGFFTGFTLTMSHDMSDIGGGLLARLMEDDVAGPGAITFMTYDKLLANKFYVKTASSFTGLTAAPKLTEAFGTTFEYSSVFGVAAPMVDNQISFSFPVELFPTSLFTIHMMARAVGMGFLDDLLGSNVCYFEIGNLSDDPIEAAIFRQFKLVVAGEFSRPLEKADIDPGMKGVRWSFFPTPQADMPSGAAFALTVVNNIA